MKLLHTSDWHLGKSDRERSLNADQLFFIHELCKIVRERSVDAVLLSGDVFDSYRSNADANRLYDCAMTKLCIECGCSVFVIAGNHDGSDRLSTCNRLLSKAGLHIKSELSSDLSPIVLGDTELFLLPWITEERVRAAFPEDKAQVTDITSAYSLVTEKMRQLFSPNKRHVILSHAYIANATTSVSDGAAVIGFAMQVPTCVFDGFDYVALGHIHAPQKLSDTVRYCGTPMPYSFGKEETQTKGVVIFDTETLEQEFVPIELMHRRKTLSGTLNELLNPELSAQYCDAYVRLAVSDSYVGLEALSELKRLYPLYIEVESKRFESIDSSVTLSLKELEELESNPVAVFEHFCREEIGEEADEHLKELFSNAVLSAEEDMQ